MIAFTKRGTKIHSVSCLPLFLSFINSSAAFVCQPVNEIIYPKRYSTCFVRNLMQEFSYRRGDYLLFGSETSGLPPEALSDCKSETYGGGTIRIPMVETYVRCLNLSVSVGIALYEASRQLNYEQLECAPQGCVNGEEALFTEDIFA